MKLLNDIKDSWNDLGGHNVIDSFEERWYEWSIIDTVEWFKFTLNSKNMNGGDHDDDYEIEDYSSDDSSDSNSDDMNDNDDEKEALEMRQKIGIDFKNVESNLLQMKFNCKKYFPIILKPFQFEPFGFKNKKDQKYLCQKVQALIIKYPKKKNNKKLNNKNTKRQTKDSKVNDFELEGFVQDTNEM